MKKTKLLSLFTGIGAFERGFERVGREYELVGFSEIDKHAIEAYSAIHGISKDLNLGDVTKIDASKLPSDIDFECARDLGGLSDTQLYKTAGNSIVTTVTAALVEKILAYLEEDKEWEELLLQ